MKDWSERALREMVGDLLRSRAARSFSVSDCDDYVQEVLLRWWRVVGTRGLRDAEVARKLAFGIAKRCQYEFRRRLVRHAREIEADLAVELGVTSTSRPETQAAEALQRLRTWLGRKLPADEVELLLLVRLERLSWRSAALAVGMNEAAIESVRKRVQRFLSDPRLAESCRQVLGLSLSLSLSLSLFSC